MHAATTIRRTGKEEIRIKAKALRAAQRRLTQLQAENDWLRWQHQLVSEMCKSFDWFRQVRLHALLGDPELMRREEQLVPDHLQQELLSCLASDDEARLLQQLSSLPHVQAQSSADAVAGLALDGPTALQERSKSSSTSKASCPASSSSSIQQPIAPPNDRLFLFQHIFSKPLPACCVGVESMTLEQLRVHYMALVRDLSLYLMQHQIGSMAAEDQPLEKMQAAMTAFLRLMSELAFTCSDLVPALQLSNCETGEQLSEPPTERIRWVVERLELSSQQQHGIARGMSVFKKLLTPVLEEMRQLQQQQVVECAIPCAAKNSAASDGTCSSGASDAAQQYVASSERGRVLEQHQQRSGRMTILLHKDYFLRTWFSCYLYGQLSWVQLALMHMLMLPFYPMPFIFFKEVAAQVAAQLAKHAGGEEKQEHDAVDDGAEELDKTA